MPTPSEIERLKEEWMRDPVWDVAETPGYEAHRGELAAFAKEHAASAEERRRAKFAADAKRIGCADNPVLAEYVFELERRLSDAAATIEELRTRMADASSFGPG